MKSTNLRSIIVVLFLVGIPFQLWAEYVMEWQSPDSLDFTIDESRFAYSNDRYDLDGDGIAEIALSKRNIPQLDDYLFYSSTNYSLIWSYTPFFSSNESQFKGFFDIDGDGDKEAIFDDDGQSGGVIAVNWKTTTIEWQITYGFVEVIFDIDNDGGDELIIRAFGNGGNHIEIWGSGISTIVSDSNNFKEIPTAHRLSQNYPNPFNPATTIKYQVQTPSDIQIRVYNSKGEKVKTLISEHKSIGEYSVVWDGKDRTGKKVSSAIYFYQLQVGDFISSKKMLLLK